MYSVEDVRCRIQSLIEKHEPEKVDSVDVLMKQFRGKEKDLNRYLSDKYSEEYVSVKRVKLKKKYAIGHKIGFGTYSIVRECKLRREWLDAHGPHSPHMSISLTAMSSISSIGSSSSIGLHCRTISRSSANNKRHSKKYSSSTISSLTRDLSHDIIDEYDEDSGDESMSPQTDHSQIPRKYAIKIIDKDNLDKSDLSMLETEVAYLRQFRECDHIVHLHDVYESRSKFCIVLDYLQGGPLFDRIVESGILSEQVACLLTKQMLSALNYIHVRGVVHRDIKPQNLIFESKEKDARIKLIDFGFATNVSVDGKFELTQICGTPNFMAPEMLEERPYDTQVDMWSAGCILHTMLLGTLPYLVTFDDKNNLKSIDKKYNITSKNWIIASDDVKDLVAGLLEKDAKKRFTAQQALDHHWFDPEAKKKNPNKKTNGRLKNLRLMLYVERMRRGVKCMSAILELVEVLTQGPEELQGTTQVTQVTQATQATQETVKIQENAVTLVTQVMQTTQVTQVTQVTEATHGTQGTQETVQGTVQGTQETAQIQEMQGVQKMAATQVESGTEIETEMKASG